MYTLLFLFQQKASIANFFLLYSARAPSKYSILWMRVQFDSMVPLIFAWHSKFDFCPKSMLGLLCFGLCEVAELCVDIHIYTQLRKSFQNNSETSNKNSVVAWRRSYVSHCKSKSFFFSTTMVLMRCKIDLADNEACFV